jgi:hypothetical protein
MLNGTYDLIEQIVSDYHLEDLDNEVKKILLSAGSSPERFFLKTHYYKTLATGNILASVFLYKIIQDLLNKKITPQEIETRLIENLKLSPDISKEIVNKIMQNEYIAKELLENAKDAQSIDISKKPNVKGIGQELV